MSARNNSTVPDWAELGGPCVFCQKLALFSAGAEPFYGSVKDNRDYDGPVCRSCKEEKLYYSEIEGYFLLKEPSPTSQD